MATSQNLNDGLRSYLFLGNEWKGMIYVKGKNQMEAIVSMFNFCKQIGKEPAEWVKNGEYIVRDMSEYLGAVASINFPFPMPPTKINKIYGEYIFYNKNKSNQVCIIKAETLDNAYTLIEFAYGTEVPDWLQKGSQIASYSQLKSDGIITIGAIIM